MGCNLLKTYTYNPCIANLGGIKNVWLAEWEEDAIVKDTEGKITLTDELASLKEGAKWYNFRMRKNVASMTSTLNNSTDGSSYVTTELALVFSRMDAAKRASIQALALDELMAVVEDSNGELWFLGADAPLVATAGAGETGTAMGDANRYTITLTDEAKQFPYRIDEKPTEATEPTE